MQIIVDHTTCSGVRCPMQYTFVIDDCKLMRECPYFTPKIRMDGRFVIQHVYRDESGDENGNANQTDQLNKA